MAHFITTIKTSLSPEEAFDYMADLRNFPEWDPSLSSAEMLGEGDVKKGSSFDLVANGTELRYVLVEFDRPRRVVAEANSPRLRSYDVIEIHPVDGGSTVTYDATVEFTGAFKLFNPFLALLFGRITTKADEGMQRTLPDASKVS